MESLSQIYAGLPFVALVFIGFIVFLTVYFHVRYGERAAAYGPTILTTTGILATFVGIAIGLLKFDTTNIQASVPDLLAGLKTAFWGSVAGVGAALSLKFRHYFVGVKSASGTAMAGEPTVEDVVRGLQNIHYSLAGDDESTLISQFKLLRSDSNERLDALKRAQIESLAKLSELGSKALIEALKEVIANFNQNLNEQFGENFKQLNAAVGQLLVWQQQH